MYGVSSEVKVDFMGGFVGVGFYIVMISHFLLKGVSDIQSRSLRGF